MDMSLRGKIAVISGGAGGIGGATARMLLEEGCKVAIFGRDRAKMEMFSDELSAGGHEIMTGVADVRHIQSMERFADQVQEAHGGIDIWINNAAIEHYVPLTECSEEIWNEVIDVDLSGVWRGSRAATPYLKKMGGGSIINISSFCSLLPTAKNGAYSVAKAGVNTLTRVMAAELAPYDIRVNCVIPGFIATNMTKLQIESIEEVLLQPISMRRFGKVEDVAKGIVYLASDMSSYVTGHELVISGGKFLVQNPQDPWNEYVGGY